MSGKPVLKSGSKRASRAPEATGDSSDSGRSRSLSAGRSSSRRVEASRRQAKTPSKWTLNLNHDDSTSEDSDSVNFTDSVSKTVKFRRSQRLKQVDKVQKSLASEYKIPKIPTKTATPRSMIEPLSCSNLPTEKLSIVLWSCYSKPPFTYSNGFLIIFWINCF